MRNILAMLLLMLTVALSGQTLVRILLPDAATAQWLCARGVDWQPAGPGEALAVADDALLDALTARGITWSVAPSPTERYMSGYHSLAQVDSLLAACAVLYPAITQITSLGPTRGNLYLQSGLPAYADYSNDVWCLKLSDNPDVEEDEPNIYFAAAIHAREAISLEVCLRLLKYLVEGYGVDPEVTALVDDNQIWFVPLVNPDGYDVVWSLLNTMQRKNLYDSDESQSYTDSDGVDLNRNFGYFWGPNGTSSDPTSAIYNGTEAWAEPETRHLRDLLRAHNFWGGVTYHACGEEVLYPLGPIDGACSLDHAAMADLADSIAVRTPGVFGGHYAPMQASDYGYTCQGTMGDWSYGEQRIFGYTIELAQNWIPDPTQVDTICSANLAGALYMAHRPERAVLSGHVCSPDSLPLAAQVRVHEIDDQAGCTPVEPVVADSLYGRYWRLLLPGSYTVTYSADGYVTQTFTNVVIDTTGQTILEVTLEPDVAVSDDNAGPAVTLCAWPNPTTTGVSVAFSPALPGSRAQLAVYDIRGRLVRTLSPTDGRAHWDGADANGRPVASGVYLVRLRRGSANTARKILLLRQ